MTAVILADCVAVGHRISHVTRLPAPVCGRNVRYEVRRAGGGHRRRRLGRPPTLCYDSRMADVCSFDVTSTVDLQEVDNAVNQAKKEIAQRYDFKGTRASIDFNRGENALDLVADDKFRMDAVWEVLQTRLVRRGVPVKNLTRGELQPAANATVRCTVALQQGIPSETARAIVKHLKDLKMRKVQAAIQGDQVRVSSPSKDELQAAMKALRGQDFGIELQFGNYRG